MLDALKSFFAKRAESGERPAERHGAPSELQIAACALLVEIAHADDEFSAPEREQIEEAMTRHFDLDPEAARALIELADRERRESTSLFSFTSVIKRDYDEGQRMVLAELVWRIVYADGRLTDREGALARRLAYLLDLAPGYLSEARRRAVGKASEGGAGSAR